jgi:hypothetical protein
MRGLRRVLWLWAVALLGAGVGACGDARTHSGSASRTSSSRGVAVAAAVPTTASSPGALPGDEDGDEVGGRGYYDSDDDTIRHFGHVASAADARAIRGLVGRYYAAAAAGDGKGACALTRPLSRETIPEEYGRPPGPPYLRGVSTCARLLSLVFGRFHALLSVPPQVQAVRVEGDHADALVGFRAIAAGLVKARRERGVWEIEGLLASPLP